MCESSLFFGTSENAVKTQVWIAVSVYALMAMQMRFRHIHPTN